MADTNDQMSVIITDENLGAGDPGTHVVDLNGKDCMNGDTAVVTQAMANILFGLGRAKTDIIIG